MNEKNFEKVNVKVEISIYNVPLNQISFDLAILWEQISPKKI